MKNPFRKRARIVTDAYSGYEVQVRVWYWPFWRQPKTNTFDSIQKAEAYAKKCLNYVVKEVTK